MQHLILKPATGDTIRRIIEENQKNSSDERSGPNVAFLPEGRHSIRWYFDPIGELFREVMIGRVGKKRFVCPDFLARKDRNGDYPSCRLDEISKERDQWRDKCRYHCMVYGHLYDTKNPGEYWTPGKSYVIIGNSFLRRALLDMLENLQENGMDMLLAMLTPNVQGFFSSVSVTKGQQGNIAIQVLTKRVDPIELGDWYQPLSDVYIQSTFDPKAYGDAIAEYIANLPAVEGEEKEEEGDEETTEVVTVGSQKPSVAPATLSEADAAAVLNDSAVDLSPRVTPMPTSKGTKASKTTPRHKAELPEEITEDMLPDGCPGWGMYNTALTTCALCPFNVECMTVGDAKS